MSTQLKEREEKILQTFEHLNETSANGIPIVVEGKNDVRALRALTIKGKIIQVKASGKTIWDAVAEIEESGAPEIVLLLDFDKRGIELTRRLTRYFEKTKIKPNTTFWKKIISLTSREVKDVEGLASYLETLQRKIGRSSSRFPFSL